MTPDDFIQNGYTAHPVDFLTATWASTLYQKRVTDEHGTRYFINVYLGKPIEDGDPVFTARLSGDTDFGALWLTLERFESVGMLERFFLKAWERLGMYYYEREN